MTDPAAFLGNYADIVTRKTRGVFVVQIEIPIEKYQAFVAAFGGPSPAEERPVAIARIDPTKAASEPVKADKPQSKRKWAELPPAQQAAIRCGEGGFQTFMSERANETMTGPETAARLVRDYCAVLSRKDIKRDTIAGELWQKLDAAYQAWLHV